MSSRLVAPTFRPLVLSIAIACAFSIGAEAQVHSTIRSGWSMTIDESPPSEFVAQSLADLVKSFEPPPLQPSQPWCCAVGNYGGSFEEYDDDDVDEGEITFIRIADDIQDNGVYMLAFPQLCDGTDCQPRWAIGGEFTSYHSVFETAAQWKDLGFFGAVLVIGSDGMPQMTTVSGFGSIPRTLPVFVGQIGPAYPLPQVWSLTVVAVPEPSAGVIFLIAAFTILPRRWRA
jgi:hypothetical protein